MSESWKNWPENDENLKIERKRLMAIDDEVNMWASVVQTGRMNHHRKEERNTTEKSCCVLLAECVVSSKAAATRVALRILEFGGSHDRKLKFENGSQSPRPPGL